MTDQAIERIYSAYKGDLGLEFSMFIPDFTILMHHGIWDIQSPKLLKVGFTACYSSPKQFTSALHGIRTFVCSFSLQQLLAQYLP